MFIVNTTFARKISLLFAVGMAAAAFSQGAQAAESPRTAASYGSNVSAQAAEKTITITPQTKWVNVNDGETVTFVKGDAHFTWHFATLHGAEDLPLSKIAPVDLMAENIVVYVDTNPLYRN